MLWLKVLALFAAGAFTIIIAVAVLLRGARKLENLSFFGLSASIAGWTFGIAFFLLSTEPTVAFFWAKVYYLFPLLIAVTLVLFVKSFPHNKKIPRTWTVPLLTGCAVLAIPLILSPSFVTEKLVYHDWGKEIVLNSLDYLLYSAYLLICYPLSLLVMYQTSRRQRGLASAQAKLFFGGFFVTFVFGVFFNLILPWFGNYRLIWIGPLFTSVFFGAIAYSIIRHRMFDIRLAIARTITYLLLLATLITAYALTVFGAVSIFFEDTNVSPAQNSIYVVVAILLAFTFEPLKRFFARLTNKIFFQDAYETQDVLDEINSSLAGSNSVNKLAHTSLTTLYRALKSEYISVAVTASKKDGRSRKIITVDGQSAPHLDEIFVELKHFSRPIIVLDEIEDQRRPLYSQMYKANVAVIARLETANELIGYAFFGFKEGGNVYSRQDLNLIHIATSELAIAIQNALRFEEIEHFTETLQEEVRDATAELRKTNRQLHVLDEAKDEFISMASHQLRTPLTSVKGYLSMVLEGDVGKVTPEQRKVLEEAYTSSQRMVYLIGDFLNVSRIQTGKFELERSSTNLAEILADEIDQLRVMAAARQISIDYTTPSRFPTLYIDQDKFRQVMMNLIDNAIYYSRANTTIAITLTRDANNVVFKVTDHGIGVPAAERHKLFTKFYRASNAKKQRPDGTGIGLFMAQKVIVAHGGSVIFESKENQGSTFGFRLPLKDNTK